MLVKNEKKVKKMLKILINNIGNKLSSSLLSDKQLIDIKQIARHFCKLFNTHKNICIKLSFLCANFKNFLASTSKYSLLSNEKFQEKSAVLCVIETRCSVVLFGKIFTMTVF